MSESLTIAIISVLGGLFSGGGVVAFLGRRKTSAEARATDVESEVSIAKQAMAIMTRTIESTVPALEHRIDDLETDNVALKAEARSQKDTIDDLQGKFTKVQLAFVINESFIKSIGQAPPVAVADLESLSTNDLRDIAMSMKNIERRRAKNGDKSD